MQFESLVREHGRFAFALAFRLLGDADEAKDVAQESFIRIWKNFHLYDPEKRFTTWLYRIVTNVSIDCIRKKRRTPLTRIGDARESGGIVDPYAPETAIARDLAGIVRLLAARLPLKQRVVFTLRDMQDLDMDEIAVVTNLSRGAIKTNLHYARRRIRELLKTEYGISEP